MDLLLERVLNLKKVLSSLNVLGMLSKLIISIQDHKILSITLQFLLLVVLVLSLPVNVGVTTLGNFAHLFVPNRGVAVEGVISGGDYGHTF